VLQLSVIVLVAANAMHDAASGLARTSRGFVGELWVAGLLLVGLVFERDIAEQAMGEPAVAER
jgi:hypothetical protein